VILLRFHLCRVGYVHARGVLCKQGLGLGVNPPGDFCIRCKANDLRRIGYTHGSVSRHHNQHANQFAASRNRGCVKPNRRNGQTWTIPEAKRCVGIVCACYSECGGDFRTKPSRKGSQSFTDNAGELSEGFKRWQARSERWRAFRCQKTASRGAGATAFNARH
jgi:hypothetical protein